MRPGPAIPLLAPLVLASVVARPASTTSARPHGTSGVVALDASAHRALEQAPPPARLQPPPATPPRAQPAAPAAAPTVPAGAESPPAESLLGVPVYPSAVFLRSFDAGRGSASTSTGARRASRIS